MEFIKILSRFLRGKKTYIICFLAFLTSLINLAYGDITIVQFFQSQDVMMFLGSLGLASHRAAIAKMKS